MYSRLSRQNILKKEVRDNIKAGLYREMSFYNPDRFLVNLIEYN